MLGDLGDLALKRLLGSLGVALILFAAIGVGFVLAFGTDALIAVGLSRQVAGSIVTVLVVAGCLYGLYWFATEMIDW